MPSTGSFDDFRIENMSGADRALMGILGSVRRPDGHCCTFVGFAHAEAVR